MTHSRPANAGTTRWDRQSLSSAHLAICDRRGSVMAMALDTTVQAEADVMRLAAPAARWRRFARPALGLLLPVGLAVIWEVVVWLGVSNGRLVPPPSKVF